MKTWAVLVMVAIAIFALTGFDGCAEAKTSDDKKMTGNISDLEKSSGMKLPASARILKANGEGGHDGTKYKGWIIASSEPFQLKGNAIAADGNDVFLQTLREAAPDEDFGKPKTDRYEFSDWQTDAGQWEAGMIETDKGFFLKLENIRLD